MKEQINFTKEQKSRAMQDGVPLTAIAFDDRHLTKEQGGKVGRIAMAGPMSASKAKKLLDFMLALLKENA